MYPNWKPRLLQAAWPKYSTLRHCWSIDGSRFHATVGWRQEYSWPRPNSIFGNLSFALLKRNMRSKQVLQMVMIEHGPHKWNMWTKSFYENSNATVNPKSCMALVWVSPLLKLPCPITGHWEGENDEQTWNSPPTGWHFIGTATRSDIQVQKNVNRCADPACNIPWRQVNLCSFVPLNEMGWNKTAWVAVDS